MFSSTVALVEPCETSSECGDAVSVKLGGRGVVLLPPPPQPTASIIKQQIAISDVTRTAGLFFIGNPVSWIVMFDGVTEKLLAKFGLGLDLDYQLTLCDI